MEKISKFELPQCPFCGNRLWYIESFLVKNRPLYKCKVCKEKSEVIIKAGLFKVLWFTQIMSVAVFTMSVLVGGKFSILGLLLILILFAGFYGLSPFGVELTFPTIKNTESKNTEIQENSFAKTWGEDTETEIYSN